MKLDLILLFLLFSGVLYLETQMPFLSTLQLMTVFAGIAAAFALVYGGLSQKKWHAAFATVFYSFALADLLFLAFMTHNFPVFLLVSFFAVVGLLKSVLSIEEPDDAEIKKNLEVYDAPEAPTRIDATPIIINSAKNNSRAAKLRKPQKRK